MPNVRDLVSEVAFVTGSSNNPFEASSDPFESDGFTVPALKIGDSGDRPADEAQTGATLDGRETGASHEGTASYFIREGDLGSGVVDALETAEVETEPVWVRETLKKQDQSGTQPKQIFGGEDGATVTVGRMTENDFRGFMVTVYAAEAIPGEIIQEEPSYTA